MINDFLQWGGIVIQITGLLLITVELYFPKISEDLKLFFEETKPKVMKDSLAWIGAYILIWVITTVSLSIWDQSMNFKANLLFTIITILVLLLLGISKAMVRLGVVLGRGNSVGGVGLVLALIGFSIELIQML